MKTFLLIVTAFAVCAMPVLALAEDLQPPWWRGQWSTTSQYWEFSTPDTGPLEPDGSPAGGQPWLPSTELTVFPRGAWLDHEHYSGRIGVWPLSGGRIDVVVDNHEPPNDFKWVRVQITWGQEVPEVEPELYNFDPEPDPAWPPTLVGGQHIHLGGVWYQSTYESRLYPNPEWEAFTIGGNIMVDELVIDTWCIPEPGVFAIAGLGLLALLGVRRRK